MGKWWYLTEEDEQGLKRYEYRGSDSSIMTAALNPFWEWFVTLLPRWMAPNLITFLGFLCVIVSYIMVVLTHPGYEALPGLCYWTKLAIYFSCAVLLFTYQTLDAVDGKQARRTKSSSPLGELFDHGCDSFVTTMQATIAISMLGIGSHSLTFLAYFGVLTSAYSFLWEEFVRLELQFGKFTSVTEIQLAVMLGLIVTGIFGTDIWHWDLSSYVPFTLPFGLTPKPYLLYIAIVALLGPFQFLCAAWRVYKTVESKSEKALIESRGLTHSDALVAVSHVFIVDLVYGLWFVLDRSFLLEHIMSFSLAYGFVMSYLMARLVVGRVCLARMAKWYVIEIAPILVMILSLWIVKCPIGKMWCLYTLVAFVLLASLHFGYVTVGELCQVLELKCFRITDKGAEQGECGDDSSNVSEDEDMSSVVEEQE